MESIPIRARNNLDIPIRLTLTRTGYNSENDEILVTVGEEGTALKDYYRICVDADISPNKEWKEVGSLYINTKSTVSLSG